MELKQVCKRYGEQQVLQNVSFRIPEGSICAVMAPSGTGKTSLLRLILDLEKPDSGEILGVPALRSAVFQEDRLCPGLSVMMNLKMAVPELDKAAALSLLEALGLREDAGKAASELSGGMARRAALARALLYPGELLVLDEPFSGLDEENRLAAAQAILRCRRGRTLLFVTHRQEDLELMHAEQCIRL